MKIRRLGPHCSLRTHPFDTPYPRRESAKVDSSGRIALPVEGTFLENTAERAVPDARTRDRWARRFFTATARLHDAGIALAPDLQSAAKTYIDLRSQWSSHVHNLAPAMRYSEQEIDPPLR